MILLLLCMLTFQCPAYAKSTRTVHLSDGDMEPVYVEPGFSTLIQFDSHPEPGLIGDQDGFKVEYMKNMVAIKPLVSKGKTNLFLFTKEGQFNFQLIASRGRHDNVVYAQKNIDRNSPQPLALKRAVPLDDLATRRLNKSVSNGKGKLTLESVASPGSKSTLVLKFLVQEKAQKIDPQSFSVSQGPKPIRIENIFLETKKLQADLTEAHGLILIRADDVKKGQAMQFKCSPGDPKSDLKISFSPDFGRR